MNKKDNKNQLIFRNGYEFLEWLEDHPEYELIGLSYPGQDGDEFISMEDFKKLDKGEQEALVDKMLSKKQIVNLPERTQLIESINNKN